MDISEPYSAADADFQLHTGIDIQDPFQPVPGDSDVNPRKRHRFPSPVDIKEVSSPAMQYAFYMKDCVSSTNVQ